MRKLSGVLRSISRSSKHVRSSAARVQKRAHKLGAGLAPLEHTLDDIVEFLDWFDGMRAVHTMKSFVFLLRESERYTAFHELVLDIEARRSRLKRLSSTFTPLQRGRYRPVIGALTRLSTHLTRFDDEISWVVRHPQDTSRRLKRMFSFTGKVRVRDRTIRYAFDPSGSILFGDDMEGSIDRIFELGPGGFKRRVRMFVDEALGSSLPEGVLDRFKDPLLIDISSVSGSESSLRSKRGTKLSINALEFVRSLFSDDHAALLEAIGATPEDTVETVERDPVLEEVRAEAIAALEECWHRRALGQEYAGVLAIERLELPSHTGSFSSIEDFVGYVDTGGGRGVQPYFMRNVGLHIAWILLCDRVGTYRPIGTAAIREIAGQHRGDETARKILAEMRSIDGRALIERYSVACARLTRAPLISA